MAKKFRITRDHLIPIYADLIKKYKDDNDPVILEVVVINQLIISKWSTTALNYIKEKAWKRFRKE